MCQGVQLILNAFKVMIGALIDGLLADDASGMLLTGCFFGSDALAVVFLQFLTVEDFEDLPLRLRSQISW